MIENDYGYQNALSEIEQNIKLLEKEMATQGINF
jgi:hypothetical protein